MYKKLVAIILTITFVPPLFTDEISVLAKTDLEKERYVWSKQLEYMDILKELKTNFEHLNNQLSNCRENFFINATEENKKLYLLETNEYSTNILVTQTLVTQALDNLDMKIKKDKDIVMKNLLDGFEKLDSYIEYETTRKDNLIKNYKAEFEEVKNKYCIKKVQ